MHTRDISRGVRPMSTSLFLMRTSRPEGRFSATITLPSSNSIASFSNGVSRRNATSPRRAANIILIRVDLPMPFGECRNVRGLRRLSS